MVRIDAEGRVVFRFCRRGDGPVFLVGDFNGWSEESCPMAREDDCTWVRAIRLEPGRYSYKYRCGGDWFNDPEAESYVPNPWGSTDSIVTVPHPGTAP